MERYFRTNSGQGRTQSCCPCPNHLSYQKVLLEIACLPLEVYKQTNNKLPKCQKSLSQLRNVQILQMQILEKCRYCKYANIRHVQTGVPEQLQLLASEQLLFSRSSDHFCCTDRGSVKASYFFSLQPIFIFRIRSTFSIDPLE